MKCLKLFLPALIIFVLTNAYSASADVSYSVNPMKLQMSVLPGKQSSSQIEVKNLSRDKPLNIIVKKANLSFKENNRIDFLKPVKSRNSTANWLSFDKQKLTIRPLSSQKVKVTIKVPSSAGHKEHYAAVLFETLPGDEEAQAEVQVGSRIAVLLIQNSPKYQSLKGKITGFEFPKFIFYWPDFNKTLSYKASFQNQGNIHYDLMTEVFIKNGKGEIAYAGNSGMKTIVPGFIDRYSGKITKSLPPGSYEAWVKVTYAGGQTTEFSKTFYVVHVKTIVVLMVLLFMAFILALILAVNHFSKRRQDGV